MSERQQPEPTLKRIHIALLAVMVLVAGCALFPKQVEIREASVNSQDHAEVTLEVDSCNADVSTDIEESPEQVVVSVTARNDTKQDCLDVITVTLDEPLGARSLIDGADGEPVAVRTNE